VTYIQIWYSISVDVLRVTITHDKEWITVQTLLQCMCCLYLLELYNCMSSKFI